jgi:phosphohistidine phosphatase SixA
MLTPASVTALGVLVSNARRAFDAAEPFHRHLHPREANTAPFQ